MSYGDVFQINIFNRYMIVAIHPDAVRHVNVASIDELKAAFSQLPADHELLLTIFRESQETQVTVQPGQ